MNQGNLEQNLKEVLDQVGLQNWHVNAVRTTIVCDQLEVSLWRQFDLPVGSGMSPNPSVIHNLVAKPIIDDVIGCVAIQHTIEQLEIKKAELEADVKRLKCFETYYNLAFKLQHGHPVLAGEDK